MSDEHGRTVAILLFLLGLIGGSYLAVWTAGYDPIRVNLEHQFLEPSSSHLFGTDDLGRDIFSRVVHGLNLTLRISLTALSISLLVGVVLGALAGFYHRQWLDLLIGWLISVVFTLPGLLVLIAILSVLEPSIMKAYIALGFIGWVLPARIVRAEVVRLRGLEFVEAERALGASDRRIVFRTVLPMSVQPAITAALYSLTELIGLEAGLSFLGLGVQPPAPSLGKMVFDGLNYMFSAWWMPVFPGLSLFAVVFIINVVASRLSRESSH